MKPEEFDWGKLQARFVDRATHGADLKSTLPNGQTVKVSKSYFQSGKVLYTVPAANADWLWLDIQNDVVMNHGNNVELKPKIKVVLTTTLRPVVHFEFQAH
jgi:hypothetical protein